MAFILVKRRHAAIIAACLMGLGLSQAHGDGKAADAALSLPPEIVGVTWEWLGLQTPKDQIEVADPASYSVTFAEDGSMALQVDCNRGFGRYTVSADSRISIKPIGATRMMCPEGSLDQQFAINLERVGSFFLLDGELLLEQPFDSGTMRFRAAD
ncbi:para-nitrobenzyl esterase [Devosia sp. YR412]|uniref:META domain-containing protein n=1 Tax=Devosia sp. YR412 TaxID=1881030 RepID=UPI0008B82596|nr:META domain-containing protein [Devosia sp. YR412]SEQ41373.1 para-nitrobenzyl esterase [Devosia sp. YR412]